MSSHVAPPERQELLAAKVTVPAHVVHRTFVGETVVLNLRSGKYHGLNATGGSMLTLLQSEGSVRVVAERLATTHERPLDDVENDLCRFCADLLERGLIEIDADGGD